MPRRTPVLGWIQANRGRSIDHTTAAANLAGPVEVIANDSGRRILNSADPDAPSVRDIARTIAAQLDHEFIEYLLDPSADPELGAHPWTTVEPIVLDTSAARALGYVPAGTYAQTVTDAVRWLTQNADADSSDGAILPGIDSDWYEGLFDYSRRSSVVRLVDVATGVIVLPALPIVFMMATPGSELGGLNIAPTVGVLVLKLCIW